MRRVRVIQSRTEWFHDFRIYEEFEDSMSLMLSTLSLQLKILDRKQTSKPKHTILHSIFVFVFFLFWLVMVLSMLNPHNSSPQIGVENYIPECNWFKRKFESFLFLLLKFTGSVFETVLLEQSSTKQYGKEIIIILIILFVTIKSRFEIENQKNNNSEKNINNTNNSKKNHSNGISSDEVLVGV